MDSLDLIKKQQQKTTINDINKKDSNFFQCDVTVALNHK